MLPCAGWAAPFAYVPNEGSGTLSVIDTTTDLVVAEIAAGQKPRGTVISVDGRRAYVSDQPNNQLVIIDLATRRQAGTIPLGESPEGVGISPDGRWIALNSDQTGVGDVFIRSFPNPSVRLQVSTAGGEEPAWSLDGKRVYYRSGNAMLAATIATTPTVRVVARDTVAADLRNITASSSSVGYDVARDGRFLGRLSNRDDYQLVIVPNWRSELEARLANAARR